MLRRGWSIRAFWPKSSVHGQETQRLSPKVPSSFKKRDEWFECVKYDYHNWNTLKQKISESWFWQRIEFHKTGGVGQPACLSCNKSHTGVTWVWAILLTASISSIWFGLLHAYWAYANETHHRHRRRHRHHRIVIVIIVTVIVIIIVMVITIITSLCMMIVWSMGNPADLCTAPSDAGDSEARTFRQTVEAVSMLKQVRPQFLELLHDCTMVWKMEFQWITIVSMYTYHGCSFSCSLSPMLSLLNEMLHDVAMIHHLGFGLLIL